MLVVSPSQAEYMARIRSLDRERCLVVAVDVGKRSAMALVADHCHEVVVDPFTFDLNESGVEHLLAKADAYAEFVGAGSVRFGVEAAGHYHRGLVARLDTGGRDVVEVNPAIVKDARGRIGARQVKTDIQDCLAMAEVLIDGLGHTPTQRSVAMATQAAWAGQRRRKVEARGTDLDAIFANNTTPAPTQISRTRPWRPRAPDNRGLEHDRSRSTTGDLCDSITRYCCQQRRWVAGLSPRRHRTGSAYLEHWRGVGRR